MRFVVHQHRSTNLHYDFRLEMGDILKSWAVPKGPSMNPANKRLAVEVADHELSYMEFEGVIPEGRYGAGRVIIWDNGQYETLKEDPPVKQMQKGRISVVLHGSKLQGGFVLVKTRYNAKRAQWLLIKLKDEFATEEDILARDRSVKSGLRVDEITG